MASAAAWQVLLIGGASGVGKTSVSYRLARHFGVGICEVDDFQVVLERMTTPEKQPAMHLWRLYPDEWHRLTEEQRLDHAIRCGEAMSVALELVIANHLRSRTPIVLDGDFILPSLAGRSSFDGVSAGDQVRAVFLYEESEEQICRNYLAREGELQPERARSSWLYSEWLRREAGRLAIPAIPARPWRRLLRRLIVAVEPKRA